MEQKPWYKQKTTWAALGAAAVVGIGAGAGFLTQEQVKGLYDIAIAGAIVFLRQAVNKIPSAG